MRYLVFAPLLAAVVFSAVAFAAPPPTAQQKPRLTVRVARLEVRVARLEFKVAKQQRDLAALRVLICVQLPTC